MSRRGFVLFQVVAGVYLLFALARFVALSWHWPLVGDATLMHYCVFLMRHGWIPYRQIVDINLPGTYFFEWLVVHPFGYGALPWRVFDLLLLAVIGAGFLLVLASDQGWRRALFPALWCTAVFTLIHGRDGIVEMGQRELVITALLAVATVRLLWAQRESRGLRLATLVGFGIAVGAAATVKPWALGMLLCLALKPREERIRWSEAMAACSGAALPLAAAIVWLVHEGALVAFWNTMHGLVPLHSSLFRKPALHLLGGAVSSVMLPMLLLGLPALVISKPWRDFAGRVLLTGFVLGCASFVIQGRGYPYHRYPSEFFLLLLLARALPAVLRLPQASRVVAACSLLAFFFGAAVVVPRSLAAVQRFTPKADPFGQALAAELTEHGGSQLAGQVQCVDMAGGCVTALLRLQLPQSTGFLYDCYAFLPVAPKFAEEQRRYREAWLRALAAHPPQVVIATNDECGPPDDRYTLLTRWPQFAQMLQEKYVLAKQWDPTTTQIWGDWPARPGGFRIYTRR